MTKHTGRTTMQYQYTDKDGEEHDETLCAKCYDQKVEETVQSLRKVTTPPKDAKCEKH